MQILFLYEFGNIINHRLVYKFGYKITCGLRSHRYKNQHPQLEAGSVKKMYSNHVINAIFSLTIKSDLNILKLPFRNCILTY